jgi:hypothetical protein
MNDKTSSAIAARSSALPEDAVDRRIREIAEAQATEERAQRTTRAMQQRQQQAAADNSKAWCDWVDQRIKGITNNASSTSKMRYSPRISTKAAVAFMAPSAG